MASEASWQKGSAGRIGDAPPAQGPMDQQSVESLLRRLVDRVEESERRYSEALDELHARLDQISQTADAARASGTPEDNARLDRLHDQVSDLAKRLEQDVSSPLEDFERLGRALSGGMEHGAGAGDFAGNAAAELGTSPYGSRPLIEAPAASEPPFSFSLPEFPYSGPPADKFGPSEDRDLDKRLADAAHRLEHSIGATMPTDAIEALNARLDEIGQQLGQALGAVPKALSLEPVERQISDLAQKLSLAEEQLAKIGAIETALNTLIERVDAAPSDAEEIVSKAAAEAARLVAEDTKRSTTERLDAMHRDLTALNERTRASDDRLSASIAAVHDSLKQLAQQAERAAPQPQRPRLPFAERARAEAERALPQQPTPSRSGHQPFAEMRLDKGAARENSDTNGITGATAKQKALRTRLGAAIAILDDGEVAPPFGRAKRSEPEDQAFDLDTPESRARLPEAEVDAEFEAPDDLVAAARRAAQAAALKAEDRASGSRLRRVSVPGVDGSASAEQPARRSRSLLIVAAAVLLAISAALLYGRLRLKPEPEVAPPAAEQSAPAPLSGDGAPAPGTDQSTPAQPAPNAEMPPAKSGASELQPDSEQSLDENAANEGGGNFTEVAKSSYRQAAALGEDASAQPQPASLKPEGQVSLPPGVVFSVEEPGHAPVPLAAAEPSTAPPEVPVSFPLPPEGLGPLPLRQAAASGDAAAQYAVALRYAQGQGTPQDLTEAAHWLERAASAGLAPAQYRLGAMYERGQGVAKDLGRARSWYEAAAEKGNVKAMHNLAVSVSGRNGDSADYALASKWYAEAAAYGLADSQYNLGILAEHGLGIPKDLAEAYKWFALAARSGDGEAAKRRDLVKLKLDPATVAAADAAVKAWTVREAPQAANSVPEREDWADASEEINPSLITRAQGLLNKLGYDLGAPDGQMGARTREAIKSFERKNGLEETGKVTIPLVTKLERLTS